MDLVLADLDKKGREFVTSCDNRYANPVFLTGMEYIKNLTINKEEIRSLFPENHWGYWWKLNHEKFHELEALVDQVRPVDKNENNGQFNLFRDNSAYTFEFFAWYVYGERS